MMIDVIDYLIAFDCNKLGWKSPTIIIRIEFGRIPKLEEMKNTFRVRK
jgi:hypothetical protein